jgi:hypothetical protein
MSADLYQLEAAVGLLIAHDAFLSRRDFTGSGLILLLAKCVVWEYCVYSPCLVRHLSDPEIHHHARQG